MVFLKSIKNPRLIRDRCGVYYFRLIVPLPLREFVGQTEFRRSLRTKDSAVARQRALSLSVAVEAIMVSPQFLTNPTLADFPHLLKPDAKKGTREKIRIDLDRDIVATDTLEEAKEAQRITANLAKARCGASNGQVRHDTGKGQRRFHGRAEGHAQRLDLAQTSRCPASLHQVHWIYRRCHGERKKGY